MLFVRRILVMLSLRMCCEYSVMRTRVIYRQYEGSGGAFFAALLYYIPVSGHNISPTSGNLSRRYVVDLILSPFRLITQLSQSNVISVPQCQTRSN